MQRYAQLPAGQSLESVLGNDYPAVATYLRQSSLDPALLDGFAPWFVSLMVLQFEVDRRGFDPAHGIEQQVAERAAADHKPIVGLETPADQFEVLAGMSLADQKRFLLKTLDETDQTDARLQSMLDAWRNGDTAALARSLSREFEAFPELYRPLTEDRNRTWVTQIAALLDALACSPCHGDLANSEVRGESASDIQKKIRENEGGMGPLQILTSTEIQAIARALVR